MERSVLNDISQQLPTLSERQKTIAQYILQHPEDAAFMTSKQLAQASEVSEASVIRFANRLGYSRYAEMRHALHTLLRGKLSQVERFQRGTDLSGTLLQAAVNSMHTDMKSIELTLSGLNETILSAVVKAFATARRVYVAGTHSEYGMACYFASTLSWIRDGVYLLDESHNPAFDAVSDMTREDVMFVLSFPPYPAATVRFADIALHYESTVIALTDSLISPLAHRSKHCLLSHDVKFSYADNSAPCVSLLSVLLNLISNYDFEAFSANLNRKQEYWEESGFYYKE